jgi:putative transcriptional regulator
MFEAMTDLYDDDDDDGEDDFVWDEDSAEALTGRLLVAMPGIDDERFEHAVILMCAHSPDYAMGIALNRPMDGLSVPELLERLGVSGDSDMPDQPVLAGGPVERERGFVVHTDDYAAPESTMTVSDGIALTATREVLQAMANGDEGPRHAILALGCAGWSSGQLEQEIKDNVWLTCDADEALIFDGDHDTKWARALAKIGVNAAQISATSGSA